MYCCVHAYILRRHLSFSSSTALMLEETTFSSILCQSKKELRILDRLFLVCCCLAVGKESQTQMNIQLMLNGHLQGEGTKERR